MHYPILLALLIAPLLSAQSQSDSSRQEEVFIVVEQMPLFPNDCTYSGDFSQLKTCADAQLMQYIQSQIRYPPHEERHVPEGLVLVQFIVGKDGRLRNIEVLRSPHEYLSEEALRIIRSMNDLAEPWTPGKQRGQPVSVRFIIPVRFKFFYR